MNLTFHMLLAMVPCGTEKMIWIQEFAPLTLMLKLELGQAVVMLIAMVTLHVLDVNLK